MQYYLAIKAQIVVPQVSYCRFVQKRNLDVKRKWVTLRNVKVFQKCIIHKCILTS